MSVKSQGSPKRKKKLSGQSSRPSGIRSKKRKRDWGVEMGKVGRWPKHKGEWAAKNFRIHGRKRKEVREYTPPPQPTKPPPPGGQPTQSKDTLVTEVVLLFGRVEGVEGGRYILEIWGGRWVGGKTQKTGGHVFSHVRHIGEKGRERTERLLSAGGEEGQLTARVHNSSI